MITIEQLQEQIRVIATEHPYTTYSDRVDYIVEQYGRTPESENCRYFIGTAPACIVGQALAHLGVTSDEVIENIAADRLIAHLIQEGIMVDNEINEFSTIYTYNPITNWINSVQRYQDLGISWRKSVTFADKYDAA